MTFKNFESLPCSLVTYTVLYWSINSTSVKRRPVAAQHNILCVPPCVKTKETRNAGVQQYPRRPLRSVCWVSHGGHPCGLLTLGHQIWELEAPSPSYGSLRALPTCPLALSSLQRPSCLGRCSPIGIFAVRVCLVAQSCPTLCIPYKLQPARLLGPCGFSRQEYWSVLPCSPPGDLPNPGIEPRSPALWADSLPTEWPGKPILAFWTWA